MAAPRRLLVLLSATLALAGGSQAAPALGAERPGGAPFLVGADEDAVKWDRTGLPISVARELGLEAVRITVPWKPGQTKLAPDWADLLDRTLTDSLGLRVVVSVYGKAGDTPRSDAARGQYCTYLADILRRFPIVADVVVWNDPNDGVFWSPQFGPDGGSIAPTEYAALLARCWDITHAVRASVNLISLTVAEASTGDSQSHDPETWYRKLGEAYRASGRTKRIFDTVGHIPHSLTASERPWTKHPEEGPIGEGDYDRLMHALSDAFGDTEQPAPGQPAPEQAPVTIWYLAQGFQTAVNPAKARAYRGTETNQTVVPAWAAPAAAADRGEGPAPDQATQLADAVRVAYCSPAVGAYFNFLLADEVNLGRQSGVMWADWTPKPSYLAFKSVVSDVATSSVDCAEFDQGGVPPRPAALAIPGVQLAVADLRADPVGARGANVLWRTTVPARVIVSYGPPGDPPTLWATAENGRATLSGLAPSTGYHVVVRAISDDGQRALASVDLRTTPPSAAPKASIGGGSLRLDGQPFFPMVAWSVCPYQYAPTLTAGIDVFALNACGTLGGQINALASRAYSLGVAGRDEHAGGGGLLGWFYPDEPDGINMPADSLPTPGPGPRWLTVTGHFYSGAAPLPWGRDLYPSLFAKADVIGFDIYPLQDWCRADMLGALFNAQVELVGQAPGKPTFQWIEADNWNPACHGGRLDVTPASVRVESWLAIAGGAQGLGFFPVGWDSDVGKAIAGIGREVGRLGSAIFSPPLVGTSSNPVVKVAGRRSEGAIYVIAVNSSFSAVRATMRVPDLGDHPLDVLDGDRRIAMVDGAFTDTVPALGYRIYIAGP